MFGIIFSTKNHVNFTFIQAPKKIPNKLDE